MRFLSAACCSAVASAAIAIRSFTAVRANTSAIVNEFAASFATRLFFFFCHSVRLCHILLVSGCELSFRKKNKLSSLSLQSLNKKGVVFSEQHTTAPKHHSKPLYHTTQPLYQRYSLLKETSNIEYAIQKEMQLRTHTDAK